ncbi:MAG: S9 family peptidase, partial [Vicinamibacterales bacterium]
MDLLYRVRGGLVVMLVAACTIALNGQTPAAGRPMTVEDLIATPRVSGPQLSPDGKTVLFVRTTTEPKAGRRNADIYRVSVDGSEPKALFAGDKNENTPRWSADGRKVAFLSNRDGATQVYVADADGKNVKKVTSLAAGAQPPLVWAADGLRLAFVSDVYAECADEDCNKRKADEAAANPVKVHRLTRLLYRHWDEWRENIRHHVFVTPVSAGRSRDITPGDFDSPPTQQEDAAIAFSPDGKTVAFVSNREGIDKEAWTTNNDVWLVPTEGGEARKLTPNPAADT